MARRRESAAQGSLLDLLGEVAGASGLSELVRGAQLLEGRRAYLDFLRYLQRFARYSPFNALLLWLQAPQARWVATLPAWQRLGRSPAPGARPLLLLARGGPLVFVFDSKDTRGRPLPDPPPAPLPRPGGAPEIAALRHGVAALGLPALAAPAEGNDDHALQQALLRLAGALLGHTGPTPASSGADRRHIPARLQQLEAATVAQLVRSRMGLEAPAPEALVGAYGEQELGAVDAHLLVRATGLVQQALRRGARSGVTP